MSFPSELLYTKDHEWLAIDGDTATVGVTGYAIEQLGDIVHLDLPEVGAEISEGDTFGTIESTKTVSDLYMPIDAVVTAVNTDLQEKLESMGEDPYKAGWLIKITCPSGTKSDELLSKDKYEAFVSEEG